MRWCKSNIIPCNVGWYFLTEVWWSMWWWWSAQCRQLTQSQARYSQSWLSEVPAEMENRFRSVVWTTKKELWWCSESSQYSSGTWDLKYETLCAQDWTSSEQRVGLSLQEACAALLRIITSWQLVCLPLCSKTAAVFHFPSSPYIWIGVCRRQQDGKG